MPKRTAMRLLGNLSKTCLKRETISVDVGSPSVSIYRELHVTVALCIHQTSVARLQNHHRLGSSHVLCCADPYRTVHRAIQLLGPWRRVQHGQPRHGAFFPFGHQPYAIVQSRMNRSFFVWRQRDSNTATRCSRWCHETLIWALHWQHRTTGAELLWIPSRRDYVQSPSRMV